MSEMTEEEMKAYAEHFAGNPTTLAAKDREIAALREALTKARISLVWFDNKYHHASRHPTYLYAEIDAALSASPAPDPAEDQSEYGPMVYSDQTQPTVYPSSSVRAPDPAEAMPGELGQPKKKFAETFSAEDVLIGAYFLHPAEAMRAKTLDECRNIALEYVGDRITRFAAAKIASRIAALKVNGEGTD